MVKNNQISQWLNNRKNEDDLFIKKAYKNKGISVTLDQ
jgi:hypothetical protein